MLVLTLNGEDYFDEERQKFVSQDSKVIELEHSLVSLSKWESLTCKAFLNTQDYTPEETFLYISCMLLTPVNLLDIWPRFTAEDSKTINDYIASPQSATTIPEMPGPKRTGRPEVITSELIYYWMVAYNIPFECQYWHLNRLLTLIRVCERKNQPPSKNRKLTKSEIQARKAENLRRREQFGTSG